MPPAVARTIEKLPHFVKALGRDSPQVRQNTEQLRGADPLIVIPNKCKGLDWLRAVLPDLRVKQDIGGGVTVKGFRYSDLEFIFGALVRIPEDCKDKVFKDVLFTPKFLYRIGSALGDDPRFDSRAPRLSTVVLMRQVTDFAMQGLEAGEETYTVKEPEDFFVTAATQAYDHANALAEGLTFRMLQCGDVDRLGAGAAALTWFGCRYREDARRGAGAEVGAVVQTMLVARRIFGRCEPDKAVLATGCGGGIAFLTWVTERGHVVDPRLDDVEACKGSNLVAAALIERLNFQDAAEAARALSLKHRWTRLLGAYPLLKAMMGSSSDSDIVRMILQLSNTMLKTNLAFLSSEAQVARVEEALGPQMDVIEAIGTGGREEVPPAQRTRTVLEGYVKMEKAAKEKDPQAGAATSGMIGMQLALVTVLESQDFRETAASIEDFMMGPILSDGERGKPPLRVDVFLTCMTAGYLFLTRFLLGRVTFSVQVVGSSTFLASIQKIRMAISSVAEARLISDALVSVLLPKADDSEFTTKSMLGYVYEQEDCHKLVSGDWRGIDWERWLSHAPEAHDSKMTLDQYYQLHDSNNKGRAMIFTSTAEMEALDPVMKDVFFEVLGYDRSDRHSRSFSSVMKACRDALAMAKKMPIQSYDIVASVSSCFLNALGDAGASYMRWLGLNALVSPFPAHWLPDESIAMRPLKLLMDTAVKLADQHADMPFLAQQLNMAVTAQGIITPAHPPVGTV